MTLFLNVCHIGGDFGVQRSVDIVDSRGTDHSRHASWWWWGGHFIRGDIRRCRGRPLDILLTSGGKARLTSDWPVTSCSGRTDGRISIQNCAGKTTPVDLWRFSLTLTARCSHRLHGRCARRGRERRITWIMPQRRIKGLSTIVLKVQWNCTNSEKYWIEKQEA